MDKYYIAPPLYSTTLSSQPFTQPAALKGNPSPVYLNPPKIHNHLDQLSNIYSLYCFLLSFFSLVTTEDIKMFLSMKQIFNEYNV